MAELLVSAVLPVLFEKLTSGELLNFATREGVRSKLKKWETTLKMIEALLIDAEEKRLTNRTVEMWLDELQDLAYDAEDILDEYATEALRRKLKIEEHQASTSRARKLIPACCIGCTPCDLWSDFSMRSKIDDVTRRLEDLCRQRIELGLEKIEGLISVCAPTSERPYRPPQSTQSVPPFYGRDEDKAKILDMVLTDRPGDTNFDVISILGMPGLGKTALAREVFNDESLEDFNLTAWVRVTTDFDVMKITTDILQSITERYCDLKDLHLAQKQLKNEIDGRKFLFVLDDVWNENYRQWTILRSPFMDGAHGSKIIVTTCHERVVLTMGRSTECHKLKLLSDNDCLSLFEKHAFDGVMGAALSDLIRQKVVEKCKGLPLVAKTLGGLLRYRSEEQWFDLLNRPLLAYGTGIFPTLLTSYRHLPSHLKRCFSYCAVLPTGYEFEEKELILLWMAEGLIQQSSENKQLEDLGSEYFRDLLSRSIFEISSSNSSKYIMHELFNDMAQKVSRNLSFRLEDETNHRSNISKKTRYASYICHAYNDKRKFEVFNVAVHLRTHLSMPNDWATTSHVSHTVISDLLLTFKKLRVLSIQNYCINGIPDSISGLRLLRYLNLSNSEIRSIPKSINSMCNLQTLILRNCHKLLKWPCSMGNLINLRHLDILGASSIKEMPMGVRKWKCLRTLSNFIVGKDSGSNLKDLKHLAFLCGELHISKLENVVVFEDTIEFILSDKKYLEVLLLEWGFGFDESQDEEVGKKALDMLRPHQNLKKLTIKHYGGTQFSSWVGDSSFFNLTVLELKDCKKCTVLPSFGLFGSLKNLTIEGMMGIKSIGSEFYGDGWSEPFLSLETLCFTDLEAWECWNPVKENESFPKLQELSIVNCPKLSKRLPNNLSSLKKLVIHLCEQLVVSLSNIPLLCELELDKCKKIVCSSSAVYESLQSMSLSNISDFGDWSMQEFKKVQNLNIDGCKELIELWQNQIFLKKPPQVILSLISIKELNFKNCDTLATLLEGMKLKNAHVEKLRIKRCNSLNFIFRGKLPQSLKKLHVKNCEKLQFLLDDNEYTCTSSSTIMQRLKKFPFSEFFLPEENVDANASHLEDLYISQCPSLRCLPSIDQLWTALTSLEIWDCSKITTLSSTGHLPMALKHLKIRGCSELTVLLQKGKLPMTLETLNIGDCEKLESIVEEFHNNKALSDIDISGCNNLKSLPEGLRTLSSLHHIHMTSCRGFASFPKGGFPNCNLRVWLHGCDKLESLPSQIHTLSSFQEIKIIKCPSLSLSEEGLPTKLAELTIHGIKQYKPLIKWGLHRLTSLTYLDISGEALDGESFQEQDMATYFPWTLTHLKIENFPELKYLPFKDFEGLPSLDCLKINDCPELTSLPSLPSSLLQLHISGCPLLNEMCKRDKGKEWSKIADISCVKIDLKFIYGPEEE